MRINEYVAVQSGRITLIPYRVEHVPQYHAWLQDPDLQLLTASEPLTLDEEYAMQASWRDDEESTSINESLMIELTFIITVDGELLGDVNLFITSNEEITGELEIMIAKKEARRKGYARESILLFMAYIMAHLDDFEQRPNRFQVKIGIDNVASLMMFEGIGFKKIKYVEYFREWELHFDLDKERVSELLGCDWKEVMYL